MGQPPRIPSKIIPPGVPLLGNRPHCTHMGWICPTVLIPTKVLGGKSKGFWGKIKDYFVTPMVTVYLVQNAVCLNPACNMIFNFGPPVQPSAQPPADGGQAQPGTEAAANPTRN